MIRRNERLHHLNTTSFRQKLRTDWWTEGQKREVILGNFGCPSLPKEPQGEERDFFFKYIHHWFCNIRRHVDKSSECQVLPERYASNLFNSRTPKYYKCPTVYCQVPHRALLSEYKCISANQTGVCSCRSSRLVYGRCRFESRPTTVTLTDFSLFPFVPPGKFRDSTSNRPRTLPKKSSQLANKPITEHKIKTAS